MTGALGRRFTAYFWHSLGTRLIETQRLPRIQRVTCRKCATHGAISITRRGGDSNLFRHLEKRAARARSELAGANAQSAALDELLTECY